MVMMKPNFAVVTFVTATLVGVGFFVKLVSPAVPPLPTNQLAQSSEDFLLQAAHQPIQWRPLTPDSISEARRAGKPILLVIGTVYSQSAVDIDRDVFGDVSFAVYLQRNFVCVRVDGMEHPAWLNAIAPLSRAHNPFLVGLQLCVLDPSARPIAFIGRTGFEHAFDKDYVTQSLMRAKSKYDASIANITEPTPLDLIQAADIAALKSPQRASMPSFPQFATALSEHIDGVRGGFPSGSIQMLTPNAWRYLLWVGRTQELARSIQPILLTPIVDWVDGGFFHIASNNDHHTVEYGKVATENAEMLSLLTQMWLLTNDPGYKTLALRTFDYLMSSQQESGLIPACRIPDEQVTGRSLRYSFSARRLRQILTDDERAWARDNLSLDVATNAMMVPHLNRWSVVGDPKFDLITKKLALAFRPDAPFKNPNLVAVNGVVIARMLESARWLDDPARLAQAQNLSESLQPALYGGELVRRTSPPAPDANLSTYLAFADMCLADYLTSGRVVSLDNGAKVLESAFDRFGKSCPGLLTMSPLGEDALGMPDSDVPEVLDNLSEASVAESIRLAHNYGRLLWDTKFGKTMVRRAYEANAYVAGLGIAPIPRVAGYYAAAAQLMDDGYVITVGAEAMSLANTLALRWPNRLVAPAFGPVRRDLQRRPAGIYVIHGAQTLGPFTLAQVANQLSINLQVEG